jgi:putative tricarboxylic transport membrane protein
LIIASFFLLVVGRVGLKLFCKLVQVPAVVLYPIVIFTCLMGSYLAESSIFDVQVMIFFGFLGYFMRKADFSYVAFLIGFILVSEWERALQQIIIASEYNPYMFFSRPVAVILMLLTFFVVIKTAIGAFKRNNYKSAKTKAGA